MTVEEILREADMDISDLRKLVAHMPHDEINSAQDRLFRALLDAVEAESK